MWTARLPPQETPKRRPAHGVSLYFTELQPVTIIRYNYVHAMLLTRCLSHHRLAGEGQRRHGHDWHIGPIEEDDVEVCPERLPATITDPSVDVFRVKRYFTCGSLWRRLLRRSQQTQWMCPICDKDADDSADGVYTSLACDSCLEWYLLTCLGKRSRPKARTWINCEVATQMLTHRELATAKNGLLLFCVVVIIGFLCLYTIWFGAVLCTLYGLSLCNLNMGTYGFNLYILFYL